MIDCAAKTGTPCQHTTDLLWAKLSLELQIVVLGIKLNLCRACMGRQAVMMPHQNLTRNTHA